MAKMRNGIIKRGSTYSYVVRIKDPATAASKPQWVGGFETHAAAAAARDETRVRARRGEHVARSHLTVEAHLFAWLKTVDVKAKTRAGYRYNFERYLLPRIGGLALQDLRPATLTSMYVEMLECGGLDATVGRWAGRRFAPSTPR